MGFLFHFNAYNRKQNFMLVFIVVIVRHTKKATVKVAGRGPGCDY